MQLPITRHVRTVFSFGGSVAMLLSLQVLFQPGTVLADEPSTASPLAWLVEATNHLGSWIWETNTLDKQVVRFWRAFEIPDGKVTNAVMRITVDNGYTLFLDGHELGRGSDWRAVTEYDVTQFLKPGRHVVAIEGFNDLLAAGLIFGLFVERAGQPAVEIDSDKSWLIVPPEVKDWPAKKDAAADWHPVRVIGGAHHHPWEIWPVGFAAVTPLKPVDLYFWQNGWFQLGLSLICTVAGLICLWLLTRLSTQAKARRVLQIERVRIARDIHDDLGAQLTQLLLLGEVAQREQPENSPARGQFNEICAGARELAQALDEVVWAVNSRRDTVRDFISHVCKYAQIFLNPTGIRCRLDVELEIPAIEFDLPLRRNLFLAVKEALNNAAKYSQASELLLRIFRRGQELVVVVEDDGAGFDPASVGGERNGFANMAQRMAEIGGTCDLFSQPGAGCRMIFAVPLPPPHRRWFRRAPKADDR